MRKQIQQWLDERNGDSEIDRDDYEDVFEAGHIDEGILLEEAESLLSAILRNCDKE